QVIDDIEKKYMYTDKAKKVGIVFEPLCHKENNKEDDEKKSRYKPLYVDCDSQKISQVIFNLLDNAMKFTTEGLIAVFTAFQRDTYLQNNKDISLDNNNNVIGNNTKEVGSINKNNIIFTIVDTGIGVNPTIKDQLFEKFSSRSTQGTGLGLYLSKKIVEAHGGKMWNEYPNEAAAKVPDCKKNEFYKANNNNNLEKKPKIGSIFRFTLPFFTDEDDIYNKERNNNKIKKRS
ncbi:MAG TPA: ATP-binding protein, partial [Candidatus Nitrosocosmicus sp.]